MTNLQFALACWLALAAWPTTAGAAGDPFVPHALFQSAPGDIYDQGPSKGAYETAMTRYEVALSQRIAGDHVAVFFIPLNEDQVWTWHADDGAVRRLAKGLFRISVGNCVNGFCAEIDCRDAGWPSFECSDGTIRDMAAPDFSTIVFGGKTYSRARPLPGIDGTAAAETPPSSEPAGR